MKLVDQCFASSATGQGAILLQCSQVGTAVLAARLIAVFHFAEGLLRVGPHLGAFVAFMDFDGLARRSKVTLRGASKQETSR